MQSAQPRKDLSRQRTDLGLIGFARWVSRLPDTPVCLQRSPNLADWEDWHTLTLGDQPATIELPGSDLPWEFYRAIEE